MKKWKCAVPATVLSLAAVAACGSSTGKSNGMQPTDPVTAINTFSPAPQPTDTGTDAPPPDGSLTAPPAGPPSDGAPTYDSPGVGYVLDAQSASGTLGPCHDPLNQWTGADGTVVVYISSLQQAQGVTYSLTVTINGGSSQLGTIEEGQDTHNFEFPGIDPESVKQVVVTAADAADGTKGGSCIVPGSPTN